MKQPKVALLYDRNDMGMMAGGHYVGNNYRFFSQGLSETTRLNVTLCPLAKVPKVAEYKQFDALIIYDLTNTQRDYSRLAGSKAIKLARGPDAHNIDELFIQHCRDLSIACVFNMCSQKYVRQFLPSDISYRQMFFGITTEAYPSPPWEPRLSDKILVTGTLGNDIHYSLRQRCCDLPYTRYVGRDAGYTADKFGELLSQFRATIAACTTDIVYKYAEAAMCGCLVFMEVNEQNGCDELEYRDGESAIFINEQNYKQRFAEYISDYANPRWQTIAAAGRQCTIDHYEQNKEINRLADLIEELV